MKENAIQFTIFTNKNLFENVHNQLQMTKLVMHRQIIK